MTNYKSIGIVVPFFGNLPDHFSFFLKSCEENITVDFLFFSDQDIQTTSKNIKIYKLSFEEFKMIIQNKFDFHIELNTPYKLVDYKPIYGYVLEDYLKDYDFWGYCDIDLIFGNIRKFLTENILTDFVKIYELGHLTLYKNTKSNNLVFKKNIGMNYKNVFQTNSICVFDEIIGMQKKYDLLGLPTYKKRDFIDIDPWHFEFRDVKQKSNSNSIMLWTKKGLFNYSISNNELIKREIIYAHFQKRKISVPQKIINYDSFILTKYGVFLNKDNCTEIRSILEEDNKSSYINNIILRIKKIEYIWKRRFYKYILKK